MTAVFVDVVLPVLAVAALGAVVGHRLDVPVAPLSALTFNLFTPALVFHSLATVEVSGTTAARIVVVVVVVFAVLAVTSVGLSTLAGHSRSTTAAAAMCASVANFGNMGLPISQFAFGDPGLDVAVVAFVAGSVVTYSGGVALASLGHGTWRDAVAAPLRVPALWAAGAGLVVNAGDVDLPEAVANVAVTLAGAAIPTMLVLLGLQIRATRTTLLDVRRLGTTVALRLGAGPLVALAAASAVGLDGIARRTVVVIGGMPTAVITTIIAARYGADQALVTRAVTMSTLLSIVTLTALVTVLR